MKYDVTAAPELSHTIRKMDSIPSIKRILEAICVSTGMGIGAVARVDQEKWEACSIVDNLGLGLKAGYRIEPANIICSELCSLPEPVIIADVRKCANTRWKEKMNRGGFRSYVSFPLYDQHGDFFGTLCTIDLSPATFDEKQVIRLFGLFSELITFHLGTLERAERAESQLREERKQARRRDRFIAVLGHDLRNPLSAISSAAQFLQRHAEEGRQKRMITIIYDASVRMRRLVDNILDFARMNLGSGITIISRPSNLYETIKQVIAEFAAIWPGRPIDLEIGGGELTVPCDADRMAQVFSNLITNAMEHGDAGRPISVAAYVDNGCFVYLVKNNGKPIPKRCLDNLFKPFVRGADSTEQKGLGLGLFIVHQIVQAHGGRITVNSDDNETVFRVHLPLTGRV